jgi:hypothetical protein
MNRSPLSFSALLSLSLAAALVTSTTGCAQLMQMGSMAGKMGGPSAGGGGAATAKPAKDSAAAWAAATSSAKQAADSCEAANQTANTKLATVIAKFEGKGNDAMGNPLPPMTTAVARLKKEKVTFSLDDKGAPGRPLLMVKDSLTEEARKLPGAPQAKLVAFAKRSHATQPSLTALRDQVSSASEAIGSGNDAANTCSSSARALSVQLGAMENGGETVPEEMFQVYARLLQANKRSEAVAAAGVALLAVTQATAAGKDPQATAALLDGVKTLGDSPEVVSPELARKVYEAAGKSLRDGCQEQLDTYYAAHPEAPKPQGPSPCSKEGLAEDRARRAGGPGAHGGAGVASTGAGGDGIDAAVARLLPRDTPLGAAAEAVLAVKNGDYKAGLKASLRVVGTSMPFGSFLGKAIDMLGLATCRSRKPSLSSDLPDRAGRALSPGAVPHFAPTVALLARSSPSSCPPRSSPPPALVVGVVGGEP